MDELDENDMKRNTGSDDTRDLHLDDIAASIDSVDIRDDFMFSYVMCNREICTELLQYLRPATRSAELNTMNWAMAAPASQRLEQNIPAIRLKNTNRFSWTRRNH